MALCQDGWHLANLRISYNHQIIKGALKVVRLIRTAENIYFSKMAPVKSKIPNDFQIVEAGRDHYAFHQTDHYCGGEREGFAATGARTAAEGG